MFRKEVIVFVVLRRVWRVFSLSAPSTFHMPGNSTCRELPFSIKPDRLLSVRDIMSYNRDHYEGTRYDMTQGLAAGPWGNPNRYDPYSELGRELPPEIMAKGAARSQFAIR